MTDVSAGFAGFLSRETNCTATCCEWRWEVDDGGGRYVFCPACGSSYPWQHTYYLGRIYQLENKEEP